MTTYTQEQCVKDDVLMISRKFENSDKARTVVVSFDDGTTKSFKLESEGLTYGPLESSVNVVTQAPVNLACLPGQSGFPLAEAIIALLIAFPLWIVIAKRLL